jgi:hypothetical protein
MRGDEFIRRMQQPARGRAVGSASPKVEPKLSKREVDEWMQMFGAGDDERD